MKVVYIAGPFRAKNAWEVEQNIRRSEEAALKIWALGAAVISPHCNTRFFDGALENDVFLKGDLEILKRCDAIYMLPDWKSSDGARGEFNYAEHLGLRSFQHMEDLVRWLNWDKHINAPK